ncbi:MAG: zinc-binding dehydrogenase [Nocardioides sp.]|uniref:zinc-binding dehydrogenase n=1 Tax=Nocardioides sp. TaxID=35761 RepID=UPI0039E4E6E6
MRAVVCHDGDLRVSEVDEPAPGPGQLLVEVVRSGICGSDLHVRRHADELSDVVAALGYNGAMRPEQRIVLGHEIVGRVAGYGADTRREWELGQLVVALPVVRHPDGVHLVGFDTAAPGGFAERTVIQEAFTFAVPDGVDAELAAFTEPLAVAWHAVRRAGYGRASRGRPAVVVGCGPIGLAVIAMLKAAGVRTVVASDLSPARRDLARRCGADTVVDPAQASPWSAYQIATAVRSLPAYLGFGLDAMARVRRVPLLPWRQLMDLADRLGATPQGPAVFECVGIPGMIEEICAAAPLHSTVVVVGVCMQPDTFRPATAIHKELDLRFCFGYDPAEFATTLAMIAGGRVDPRPLHTGTVGLDGVAQAFDDLARPERHAKILVDPRT